MKRKNLTEILLHQGEFDLPFNAVSPPIVDSSIFCFKTYDDFKIALSDEPNHYLYTRGNNPTVKLCEEKLASIANAEKAKLVSSGVSAISLAILDSVKQGDHVICVKDCYSWTKYMFDTYLKRFGVEVTYVDGVDSSEFEKAIKKNTSLIYLESPTSLTFKLQNLKEVSKIAKKHKIRTIIDNTWATPYYQSALELGIDIEVHSASKYFGGNSDVIAGVIFGSKKDIDHIFEHEFLPIGTVPTPHQAWLIMRNLRTFHLRMPYHFKNALEIAKFLEKNDKVESVLYPMLESYSQYPLAKKQMSGGSGLFSFRLKTDKIEEVKNFVNSLKYFKKAVSWGGYESLVFPAGVKFEDDKIPSDKINLIRVHIGLEDTSLLIEDLEKALEYVK